jgi:uncharacterized coiled-coil DUF342 family protein
MSTLSVQPKQTETDIAVLQVQYSNLTEKVDDLKTGLKEMRDIIDENNTSTQAMMTSFQKTNVDSHTELAKKITALEKWKWMLMGAGVLAGSAAGPSFLKLFGVS